MMDAQAVVHILRALVQLGITVEQYRDAVNNPDLSDEELQKRIESNTDTIKALRDRDH